MMKQKGVIYSIALVVLIVVLMAMNVSMGSVSIPLHDVYMILMNAMGLMMDGEETSYVNEAWRYIVLESRLPQAITALLSGASLAVSGLLLQTAFRNPLAGPDVFGINSGAALAVALVMLGMGGNIALGWGEVTGFVAILLSAFAGAMLVTGIIFLFSTMVRSHVMLLIIGIMIGYVASSAISLLNFFSTAEGVKSYAVWGMGSFGNVTMDDVPLFATVCLIGLAMAMMLIKPLNALLLGEQYAESLGIRVRRLRRWLLVVTGILTAIVTAFCGPIAFIGLATPHVGRLLLTTENHRQLMPVTMLLGAVMALLCNLICFLPGENGLIPLNAVTPLLGAPVIIYVIAKRS